MMVRALQITEGSSKDSANRGWGSAHCSPREKRFLFSNKKFFFVSFFSGRSRYLAQRTTNIHAGFALRECVLCIRRKEVAYDEHSRSSKADPVVQCFVTDGFEHYQQRCRLLPCQT